MRKHLSVTRLIVALLAWLTASGPAQEYYTRTAGPGDPGGRMSPIIGNQGMFSAPDIHMHPSSNDQSEVSIAVNWCNTVNLLAGCNNVGFFGYAQSYFYSENRGVTWMGGEQLPNIPYYTSDPAIAYDTYNIGNPNGYASGYFNYLSYEGFYYGLSVQKTTDGGETWLPPVSIPSPGNPDKNHMTIDPTMGTYADHIYVGYTDFISFPGSPVRVSRSTNRGVSFSTPVNISLGETSLFSQGVNLAVGPQGHVYAVWAIYDDWSDPDPDIWDEEAIGFARSTNGGATWEPPRRIMEIDGIRNMWFHKNLFASPIRVNSFPVLAVDRSGGAHDGRMYLVWSNTGWGLDKSDIHLSRSTDGGETWSTPLRVNDDNTSYDQWMPWVTVSPYGRVTIVFYDSRNDAFPPSNQSTEAWIAESTDGGLTFVNTRVSDVSFVPMPIPNTATGYMGDYLGITSSAGRAYPCWADNRTGVFQLYVDIQDTYVGDLQNIASTSRSPAQFATAYGTVPKLVYAGGKWHRLFHVNEHIAYSQSADDGTTWTGTAIMSGAGTGWLSNPSLYSSGGKLHTVFRSDDGGVYHCRGTFDGIWETPQRIASINGSLRGIASVIDNNGIGHVFYSSIPEGSSTCYLSYGTFNVAAPAPVLGTVTNIGFSPTPIERISAAVNPATGAPHATWENNGEVLHRTKSGNLWLAITNVSASPGNSGSPVLVLLNGTVHLAWQEDVNGNQEIYYRTRTLAGSWSLPVNLSNTQGPSIHPNMISPVNNEPLIVWADSTGGNLDLRYSLPTSGETDMLGSGSAESRYPVCGVRNTRTTARVVFICTDGSSPLYEIGCGKVDFIPGGGGLRPTQVRAIPEQPDGLSLSQNTPNPFNPTTQIRFSIPSSGQVSLRVYDIIGREIATLVDEPRRAGEQVVSFDAGRLPSGIYMYRLQHAAGVRVGRMILSK